MRRAFFITLCIFTLTTLTQARSDVTAQTTHYFAYHITSDYNSGGYIAVVPNNTLARSDEYIEVPVEEEWRVPRVKMSPNGEWAAMITSLDNETGEIPRFVRLFNIRSGEVRTLDSGYVADFQWSPNGQYLLLRHPHLLLAVPEHKLKE